VLGDELLPATAQSEDVQRFSGSDFGGAINCVRKNTQELKINLIIILW
jgi:hypothetical protein